MDSTITKSIEFKEMLSDLPDLLRQIGDTPLIRIDLPEFAHMEVYAKAEWMNPGGSVKDRAALNMILYGLQTGELTSEKIILEATSGNTGIALAMIASSLGLRVELCIPENASKERISILKAYGAVLHLTDPLEGTDGAILLAQQLNLQNPERYFYTDQYSNNMNWMAHYHTTAVEILQQTECMITHFVACLGTSGTFMGIARRLEDELEHITTVSVQPDTPFHGLEGVKHMGTAIVPAIYDEEIASKNITVSTEDAYNSTRTLARECGLLVGISSGAVLEATRKLAKTIQSGVVVMIFPDKGDRYLTENLWRD